MTTPLLKLENICKYHRTEEVETAALDGINLQVNKGDFLAIMGPSGCGKSTLLNIIGLLDTPSSGKYFIDDEEVGSYNESERALVRKKNIGVIFQSFNLIDELTVRQNVELPLLYQNMPEAERSNKVDAILERVGISHRHKHYPQQLSGGQQQRVAIARAIVANPKLLLADEPTGNLDSKNGNEVMELLKTLNQDGMTIVMVTHSQQHATYGSQLINVLDGKVVKEDAVCA